MGNPSNAKDNFEYIKDQVVAMLGVYVSRATNDMMNSDADAPTPSSSLNYNQIISRVEGANDMSQLNNIIQTSGLANGSVTELKTITSGTGIFYNGWNNEPLPGMPAGFGPGSGSYSVSDGSGRLDSSTEAMLRQAENGGGSNTNTPTPEAPSPTSGPAGSVTSPTSPANPSTQPIYDSIVNSQDDGSSYQDYVDGMSAKIAADKAKAILGDTDNDGMLDKDEVLTQFDKNKDGKITKQELGVALTSPQVQTGEHGVKTIAGITITDQGALDKAAFTAKTANWTQKQWDDWKNFVNLAKQNEASVERTGEQSAAWKNFSGNVDTINKMKALGNKGSDADLLATAGQMSNAQKQELNKVFQDKQGGEFKNEFSGIDPRIGEVLNSSAKQDVKNLAIAQINNGNTSSADNLVAFFGGTPATATQSDPNFDPALKHPTLNPTGSVQVDKDLKALFASANKPTVAGGGNPHETPATTFGAVTTTQFTQEPRPSATIGKMIAM